MDTGIGFGMGLGMWIFWLVIIAIIVLLVRAAMGGGNNGAPSESALELLKKRYAKGEISKEEYERIRRDLEK